MTDAELRPGRDCPTAARVSCRGRGNGVAAAAILAIVAGAGILFPSTARAQSGTWDYEEPRFTVGETTPLTSRSPNSGDPSLRADFSSMGPDAFLISSPDGSPNALMVGQFLVLQSGTDSLRITFSAAVTHFSTDYAVSLLISSTAGSLTAVTDGGETFLSSSGNPGAGSFFQGGTLAFTPVNPFLSVVLTARSGAGGGIGFALDNTSILASLAADTPEPGSLALVAFTVGSSMLAAGGRSARRKGTGMGTIRRTVAAARAQ